MDEGEWSNMKSIIVAVSPENVIGLDGRIPWYYPSDLKRFKRLTTGTTIIMGRLTWESLGRALPNRRNIVISNTLPQLASALLGIEVFRSIDEALAVSTGDVWFIGGAKVYEEAMKHVDVIDVTYVPDSVHNTTAIKFPAIDEMIFEPGELVAHENDDRLKRREYRRKSS